MKNQYNICLNKLNNIFEEFFLLHYRELKGKSKRKILKYAPDLYKKWYYSSLVENSYASPAAIIEKAKYNGDKNYDEFVVLTSVHEKGNELFFKYNSFEFGYRNHIILKDLETLVFSCFPYIEVDGNEICEDKNKEIGKLLSYENNFYTNYLYELALDLNILEKMPSLYVQAVKPSANYKRFFEKNNKEKLELVFDSAVNLFSNFITDTLSIEKDISDYVKHILEQPVSSDDMFKQIYSLSNIDLDLLFEDDMENADVPEGVKEYLNMGLYFFGVGLDKYFFTPFGHYLKIINPLYIMPCNLEQDMDLIYSSIRENRIVDAELFSPCSFYSLTQFGNEYFQASDAENKLKLNDDIDLLDLMTYIEVYAFDFYDKIKKIEQKRIRKLVKRYRIRFTLVSHKAIWFTIEVVDGVSLSDIHFSISYLLGNTPYADYCFYIGNTKSIFTQYTPDNNGRKHRKTETSNMGDLRLFVGDDMIYEAENGTFELGDVVKDEVLEFNATITNIANVEDEDAYPKLYKLGKKLDEIINSNI